MTTTIDEALYAKIYSIVTPVPVEQDVIDETLPYTRVFFTRHSYDPQLFLNRTPALTTEVFDVECISDVVATARSLTQQLYALNGFTGVLSTVPILYIQVSDQNDNYFPKNQWANDSGLFVRSIKLTIYR